MSQILNLGKDNKGLPDIIAKYDNDLLLIEQNLRLTGKTLDFALKEQGTWPSYYSQRRAEIKTLMKHLDACVYSVRSSLTRRYVENHSRQLGERLISTYVDSEAEYLSIYGLYLEVAELYDKYDAVVEAFDKRGFALRDLTLARTHSIQDATL